jgi:hypothetical protein
MRPTHAGISKPKQESCAIDVTLVKLRVTPQVNPHDPSWGVLHAYTP